MTSAQEPREALAAFAIPDAAAECRPVSGGHINRTWRAGPWLLQRLDPDVFPDGQLVMENTLAVTMRLADRAPSQPGLRLVATRHGGWWHRAPDGAIWRVFGYIAGRTFESPPTPAHAEGAARVFGEFARLMSDPPLRLHEPLPGFHDTRRRLAALESAAAHAEAPLAAGATREIDAILGERALAAVIPARLDAGELPRRVAHNDAKIANVVFDTGSAVPLAVIDLDTTMPGSPLHDFGDLVRSMVSDAPEDAADPASVRVREDYFAAIARGFLAGTRGLLFPNERELLVTASRAIALEQAARFLADHLDGDRYYPLTFPGQNLVRARAQLALFQRLTAIADRLEAIVARDSA